MSHNGSVRPFKTIRPTATTGRQILDRFGREIQQGDVVMLPGQGDVTWRVITLKPDLSPQAPPGLYRLHLVAENIAGVIAGAPIQEIVKVVDVSETQHPQDAPQAEETKQ